MATSDLVVTLMKHVSEEFRELGGTDAPQAVNALVQELSWQSESG